MKSGHFHPPVPDTETNGALTPYSGVLSGETMDKVKRRKLDSFEKTSTPLCPELNGLYFASKH
jgi:hypothetical protein